MTRALVYGMAIVGTAVARALVARGYDVVAADDRVTDDQRAVAAELGIDLIESPDLERTGDLVRWSEMIAPAPGIAEAHPLIAAAAFHERPLRTEIDLAYEWEQDRRGGPRPMLAVTGTDGKTTTTLLATAMLRAAGVQAMAAGNTDLPLVEALDDPTTDVFVVECSSFRLNWITSFRPDSAVWLNLAPDHLNWHTDIAAYVLAKSKIWANQRPGDIAIGNASDPVVMAHLRRATGRRITFGLRDADYHCTGRSDTFGVPGTDGMLIGPTGPLCAVAEMRRSLPHDITNALAAAALVQQPGLAASSAIVDALRTFTGPPHRIEPVGDAEGVRWFNDSKATTPHATLTAIRAFDSLVLIAGGRNKGLDLTELGSEPQRMRGVVAIGEAADLIAATFDGVCPVIPAASMAEAVAAAAMLAESGDAVVLSPACASFDWYEAGGYPARGDDFRQAVRDHLEHRSGVDRCCTQDGQHTR